MVSPIYYAAVFPIFHNWQLGRFERDRDTTPLVQLHVHPMIAFNRANPEIRDSDHRRGPLAYVEDGKDVHNTTHRNDATPWASYISLAHGCGCDCHWSIAVDEATSKTREMIKHQDREAYYRPVACRKWGKMQGRSSSCISNFVR